MTPTEVAELQRPEIQAALLELLDESPDAFAMRHGKRDDWPVRAMAEQIRARRKARTKLAGWPIDDLILTTRGIEQCSSLALARFKASLVSGPGLDLCCGLGIDALHCAANGAVTACELDAGLVAILRHNAAVLGIDLTIINADGLDQLASFAERSLNWIYADPDRRDGQDRRQTLLGNCSPDLTNRVPELARVAGVLLVKLAPAIDRDLLREELPHLQRLLFVSHRGECKEALAWCDAAQERPHQIRAEAVIIDDQGSVTFTCQDDGEPLPSATTPQAMILEPDPAILRANAIGTLARQYTLHPLHPRVSYLTGDSLTADAPGRRLRVIESGRYQPKGLRQRLKQLGITGCQIARRHFPHDPDTIAKQLRITASGTLRLLCYRDPAEKLCWALGEVVTD